MYAVEFKRGNGATFSKTTTAYVGEKTLEMLSVGDEAVVVFPKEGLDAFRLVKGTYSGNMFKTYSVRDNGETVEELKIKRLANSNELKSIFMFVGALLGCVLGYVICKISVSIGVAVILFSLLFGAYVFLAYSKILKLKKLLKTPGSLKIINAKMNKSDGINMYFGASNNFKVSCFGIFRGFSINKDNECVIVINKLTAKSLMVEYGVYNGDKILTINM